MDTWVEFEIAGRITVTRYRTNADASHVEYWSEHHVPGLASKGWNRTRSETTKVLARKALKGHKRVPV